MEPKYPLETDKSLSRVGLEPTTTRLKAERSDQLSYRDEYRPDIDQSVKFLAFET